MNFSKLFQIDEGHQLLAWIDVEGDRAHVANGELERDIKWLTCTGNKVALSSTTTYANEQQRDLVFDSIDDEYANTAHEMMMRDYRLYMSAKYN